MSAWRKFYDCESRRFQKQRWTPPRFFENKIDNMFLARKRPKALASYNDRTYDGEVTLICDGWRNGDNITHPIKRGYWTGEKMREDISE